MLEASENLSLLNMISVEDVETYHMLMISFFGWFVGQQSLKTKLITFFMIIF